MFVGEKLEYLRVLKELASVLPGGARIQDNLFRRIERVADAIERDLGLVFDEDGNLVPVR